MLSHTLWHVVVAGSPRINSSRCSTATTCFAHVACHISPSATTSAMRNGAAATATPVVVMSGR
jgi:hypothetical protein